MELTLALDQGSHASRAILFDATGTKLAEASANVELYYPDNIRAEHETGQLLDSVHAVIRELLDSLTTKQRDQITACGLAVQRSSVLAWNDEGASIGKVLGWQDVRGAGMLPSLAGHAKEIRGITGLPLSPYYGASKLRWLLDDTETSGSSRHTRLRLSPLSSYLLHRLLENRPYVLDHCNAQRSQLFDIRTLDWSPRLLQWFGVPLRTLPGILPVCADYGRLADSAIAVSAVCGDQNAAMLGAGELPEDTVLVNIGSGAFLLRRLARLSGSDTLLTGIAYSDAKNVHYLREATINGAGSAVDWAARTWRINRIHERLPGWLETVTGPPVFINTVGGLGTPWMRGELQPSLVGANANSGDAERAVAVIESIVFLIQINLALIGRESPVTRLRLSGGLSRLDGLCRKLSNLSGLAVERSDQAEATARGVAWLAAGRPGSWNRDRQIETFTPEADAGLQTRYQIFQTELERLLA